MIIQPVPVVFCHKMKGYYIFLTSNFDLKTDSISALVFLFHFCYFFFVTSIMQGAFSGWFIIEIYAQ